MNFHLHRRERGFTLIELLVVIAIIAILAAVLFPVFAQAKLAAKKTQTLANVKNISTGFTMYAADADDTFPPLSGNASDIATWNQARFMFTGLVDPYIKNGLVSATGELKDIWADPLSKPLLSNRMAQRNTFAYNAWGLGGLERACISRAPLDQNITVCNSRPAAQWGDFSDLSYNVPAASTSLQAPAETVLIVTGDQTARPPQHAIVAPGNTGHRVGIYGSVLGDGDRLQQTGLLANADNKQARERLYVGDMAIVGYTDGHAKAVKNATLWHNSYTSANGRWRGAVPTGPAMNRGWARQFSEQ